MGLKPCLSRYYDEGIDGDEQYDPDADVMGQDDMGEANGIVDGNDPTGLTAETPNTEKITTPYMTKYERARILGTRALQIRWVAPSSPNPALVPWCL